MKAEELKNIMQSTIESHLLHNLLENGFKWKKSSLIFARKRGDFEQSIHFYISPPKYSDDNSMGHISIMIRFNSKEVNQVASELIGAKSKFEQIEILVNVDVGLVIDSHAIGWRPKSIEELTCLFENDIKSLLLTQIVPFFDSREKMQDLLTDFENEANYFFWTSSAAVALRAIAMYSIIGKNETAEKVARKYYLTDKAYRKRYMNVLNYFSIEE